MKTKILRRRFSFFIEPGNDRKKYRDYGRFMEITHFVRQQLRVLLFFFLTVRRLRATLSLTVCRSTLFFNTFYYIDHYLQSHFEILKIKIRYREII